MNGCGKRMTLSWFSAAKSAKFLANSRLEIQLGAVSTSLTGYFVFRINFRRKLQIDGRLCSLEATQ